MKREPYRKLKVHKSDKPMDEFNLRAWGELYIYFTIDKESYRKDGRIYYVDEIKNIIYTNRVNKKMALCVLTIISATCTYLGELDILRIYQKGK